MSSVADRVRLHRERVRNGRQCLKVVADVVELEQVLIDARLLPSSGTDNREQLEAALCELLRVLCLDHRNALRHEP